MKKTLLYSLIIFLSLHLNSSADLVGYWNLDGDFRASSGNGNDGTINGAKFTSDRNGVSNKSALFDGANQ